MDKESKEQIIKEVLAELKSKNLIKYTRSSYRNTEKVLFSYPALPEAIKILDEEIKKIKKEATEIDAPESTSSKLVLNEREGTYVYANETIKNHISELKQTRLKTRSTLRLINKALEKIEEDKWYKIIELYYFEGLTIEEVAEKLSCSIGTVHNNKKRLVDKLKIYIYLDEFLEEI